MPRRRQSDRLDDETDKSLDKSTLDLERKRDILKSKLNRFKSFLDSLRASTPDGSKLIELDTRLRDVETNLLSQYNDVQFQLEGINFDQYQEDSETAFESSYYDIVAKAKEYLFSFSNQPQSSSQNATTSSNISNNNSNTSRPLNVKLPTIELPKFSGSYDRWLEFKELYVSLIHNASYLDPVQKLHYLRASLGGSAAQCIQSIDVSGTNYELAWSVLCQRFDNKKLVIHNHIKALFNMPELKSDSSLALRNLIDCVSKNLKSLESMGINTDSWDPLIIYLVTSKFDSETIREWEQFKTDGELPTIDGFKTFLTTRADYLDKISMHKVKPKNFIQINKNKEKCLSVTVSNKFSCYYCKKPHSIYKCPDFIALPLKDKNDQVRLLKLCDNCLQKGHEVNQCRYGPCRQCQEKHNSVLHPLKPDKPSEKLTSVPVTTTGNGTCSDSEQSISFQTTMCNQSSQGQVLLATALVEVEDSQGNLHICKALLDSASMSNFISKEFAERLGVSQNPVNVSVSGIDEAQTRVTRSCDIEIKSRNSNFKTSLHCLILPIITDKLPVFSLSPNSLAIPKHIALADPTFYKSSKIDLLIGAGTFWTLLCKGTQQLGENKPILQNSKLGWYISGGLITDETSPTFCHLSKNLDIQSQLTNFWELEEVSLEPSLSSEEEQAEQHFKDTIKRNEEGRFVVSIPLKEPRSKLGESKEGATKQFLSLEKRLASKPVLKEMYTSFLQEYADLKHMSPFQPAKEQVTYFSPHHGVLREESVTTKLRVVFNSSFPSSSGFSYNSLQMVGPTVQEDLLSILLRFRQHSYVIAADICKMYRQILIADEFKPLQLILWRSCPENELCTFSLDTVVYGTASAPFLATRCLIQLSVEHQQTNPQASEVIKRDFYVDDLLTGASSVEQTIELANQVSSILASAGFDLRKWKSNHLEVLQGIESSSSSDDNFYFGSSDSSKTLGLLWSSENDTFSFFISDPLSVKIITKRVILSETAKIFDPLGLVSPVVVRAKIFLQKLWSLNLPWDAEVPQELANKWCSFRSELPELNHLKITRQATCKHLIRVELHGFSDASQSAYGACIYIRTVDKFQNVHVHLLCSKTRVAPLKSVSIPKLELCGALLLSQLYSKVVSSLTVQFNNICFWIDSTVALSWIRSSPHYFQVFVGNRVTDIQKVTPSELWRYVPTDKNPADLLSRGMSPKGLINSNTWFSGPDWLRNPESSWPVDITWSTSLKIDELPEVRKNIHSFVVGEVKQIELFPFQRLSSFTRINRVMAYCRRFIKNCRTPKGHRVSEDLTLEELREANNILISLSQQESFSEDFSHLTTSGCISRQSSLRSLTPFIKDRIIRVGGRLKNSPFPFDKKHPALLSSKHHLTELLFMFEHCRSLHCGTQLLLSNIRENYWPIAGKNLAKRVVHKCIVCFRFKPRFIFPLMGDLPKPRVCPTLPFSHVGVDYAGPFYYKDRKGRGGRTFKCYLCLFICLTVKAVHLELVTDMSTTAFLEAFNRFIARRGKPSSVYSDNGSNFIGANNKLKELGQFLKSSKSELIRIVGDDLNIKWHFLAAYSPHQGGIWEAGIKSAKQHLTKVLTACPTVLTFESFCTIITQIESILNSRPLTPLTSDPNDFNALTPAHFLIGRPTNSIPHPDLETVPTNRLSLFENLQKLKQQFWKRWSGEYIHQLQQRQRWNVECRNIAVGDVVLVHDNDLPPFKWRLGRVCEVYPGTDGNVRVASVKTATGVIKRAVIKLAPLPLD